jgi:hypothetical protein
LLGLYADKQFQGKSFKKKDSVVEIIGDKVKDISWCPLILDEWTSPNYMEFLGIIIQFAKEGKLQEYVLKVKKMCETNSEAVRVVLQEVIEEYNLQRKILAITRAMQDQQFDAQFLIRMSILFGA